MRHRFLMATWIFAATALAPTARATGRFNVGLKNFRQFFEALVLETGVNPTDPAVVTAYSKALTRLPRSGAVAELTTPTVLAVASVAGAFCARMIDADALETDPTYRHAHQTVDFGKGPSALTDGIRQDVVNTYGRLFWQRMPTADERALLATLFADAATGIPDTPLATKSVLHAVCGAAATSLAALVN